MMGKRKTQEKTSILKEYWRSDVSNPLFQHSIIPSGGFIPVTAYMSRLSLTRPTGSAAPLLLQGCGQGQLGPGERLGDGAFLLRLLRMLLERGLIDP